MIYFKKIILNLDIKYIKKKRKFKSDLKINKLKCKK
jgi:hypothetical protein